MRFPKDRDSDFFPRLYGMSPKDNGSLYAGVQSPCDMDIIPLDKPKSVILAMPFWIRMLLDD